MLVSEGELTERETQIPCMLIILQNMIPDQDQLADNKIDLISYNLLNYQV